ncbi:MAG TPA: PAS domain S-box protein, partial [Coriobacteriia bacterium]
GEIDAVVDAAHGVPLLLHQAQEALQASEEKYRTIVTMADEGIWTADANRVGTFANERMASMLGYTVPEMIGRTAGDFVDASAREEALQGFERRRQGVRERRDVALRRKDGTVLWASVALSPLVDSDGRFAGSLAMVTDITEQRRLEEARRSTEERFSLVFQASPIPIAIATAEGDFLEVNDRFVEFSGYPSEDLVGRSTRELGMWAEPADRQRFVDAVSREGRVRDFEASFCRKSGETRDVLLSVESIELRDVAKPVRVIMFMDVTDRKRAEDELRGLATRLAVVLDNITDGFFTLDRELRYTNINISGATMVGRTPEQLIGRLLLDEFPQAADTSFVRAYRRVSETGEACVVEDYYAPLDRWFETRVYPSPPGVSVFFSDISARKRGELALKEREEALRASESRLRQAQQIARIGNWELDLATSHLWWSEEMFRVFDLDPAEFGASYEAFLSAIHPDDRDRVNAAYTESLEKRTPYEIMHRLLMADGRIKFVEERCETDYASDGTPLRSRGTMQDITERREAAELLQESEERYRVLFDGSPLPMWLIDQETLAIAVVNEAAVRHYGYSREEFLSKTMREIWHPDEVAVAIARLAAASGKPWSGVRRHFKKGGASITVEVFSHTVRLAGRRYRLSAIRDITDQRELEERFRQSQKMEAVGRLAGGVAHDFNNLLTVIFGYSDVLLQGLGPGPLHEATQEVRRASERAAALTRQLLAFSRKQTLVPEVLDLGEVVSGMSTMVERLIGEDVKVSVVVSPNLGRVKADRGQLEQVVMNIAVNARDAMPKGGSLIFELQNVELDDAYTATHAEVEPGPYVLLAISDTGTGMDAETQKRIFEPFFTTKEAGKGTGLGLSTVHGIVHQSGGSIGVYSEPGRGTTFKVYLPRFAGDAAAPRSLSGIHPALTAGSETVLVVEDEAAIRQLTNLILKKAGYTVLLAESPVAAERIAGSHPGPIHLLLTDVVMPGMRGPELAERLIRLRPDLRVLFMSGYTDDAITHHGMLDAGREFLQKPFTPLRLTQKIREVLGRGSEDAGSSSS